MNEELYPSIIILIMSSTRCIVRAGSVNLKTEDVIFSLVRLIAQKLKGGMRLSYVYNVIQSSGVIFVMTDMKCDCILTKNIFNVAVVLCTRGLKKTAFPTKTGSHTALCMN